MAHHDKHRDRGTEQHGANKPDEQEELDRALQREPVDLPGDMEEDRNLSGSSTFESLAGEPDLEDPDEIGDLEETDDLDDDGSRGFSRGDR